MIENFKRLPIWVRVAIGLLFAGILALHPIGRAIVIFILPLGRGIDDFIVVFLLLLAAVVFWFGGWQELFAYLRHRRGGRK